MKGDARALVTRASAALWLATTLLLTLQPVGQGTSVRFWGFFTETMAGVDYAQNVVLFLPLGWIASRGRWRWWHAVLAGLVVSGSIEFIQQWVPGRTSQATDIAFNIAGTALGWWMATRATQPRVRLAIAFSVLIGFLGLHQLNTMWPEPVELVGGAGVWQTVDRISCPAGTRETTACIVVPNTAQSGNKYVRVVGVGDRTYARVQSSALGRTLTDRDCVLLMFENTIGTRMRLRPPLEAACGVADTLKQVILLQVDPRLEHEVRGEWTPTRVGAWMWPVWPFQSYQPLVQVVAAALTFVVLVSLMIGTSPWVIPAGYLAMLEVVALIAGMRTPGWWEIAASALGWLIAAGAVRLDRWWRAERTLSATDGGT
ncbi:MAG TPA: VanZ family protein [Gemmatimonadaceae bacterium]|jgi:hypothetical protein